MDLAKSLESAVTVKKSTDLHWQSNILIHYSRTGITTLSLQKKRRQSGHHQSPNESLQVELVYQNQCRPHQGLLITASSSQVIFMEKSYLNECRPQGLMRYNHTICLDSKYLAPFMCVDFEAKLNTKENCQIFGVKTNCVMVPLPHHRVLKLFYDDQFDTNDTVI